MTLADKEIYETEILNLPVAIGDDLTSIHVLGLLGPNQIKEYWI